MNAGSVTCSTCGGVNANPQQPKCHFCGSQLALPAPPPGYGAYAPQPYGAPPGYGASPGYGAPPGYGPQPGHGAPHGHGPQPGYGAPPGGAYGAAPPGYQVHGFGGAQPFQYAQPPVQYGNAIANGITSGWSTFFWIRLWIAVFAIGISLLGACVSALSH